jgi:hypothetical protein
MKVYMSGFVCTGLVKISSTTSRARSLHPGESAEAERIRGVFAPANPLEAERIQVYF